MNKARDEITELEKAIIDSWNKIAMDELLLTSSLMKMLPPVHITKWDRFKFFFRDWRWKFKHAWLALKGEYDD